MAGFNKTVNFIEQRQNNPTKFICLDDPIQDEAPAAPVHQGTIPFGTELVPRSNGTIPFGTDLRLFTQDRGLYRAKYSQPRDPHSALQGFAGQQVFCFGQQDLGGFQGCVYPNFFAFVSTLVGQQFVRNPQRQ